jgi:endonuclease/exonuclease/phosphatase family metal-dependent hydrolase
MRWLIAVFLCLTATTVLAGETLRVTTWNLKWFPSGKANIRDPVEEPRRIAEAARVLKSLAPDVVLLQEVRDWTTCERLAASLKPLEYQVLVCSAFQDGGQLGWQQEAIIAKKPAQSSWSEPWKPTAGQVDPPRGFAFAAIRVSRADIGFYCVHLKSNLTRGDFERQRQLNILKREQATEQLMDHVRELQRRVLPAVKAVIVGGDFNTNRDQPLFVSERTLDLLASSGFKNAFPDSTPLVQRITHPANEGYPNATFDYIFSKGLQPSGCRILETSLSDHRPVTCSFVTSDQ